jgi:DNA polymerase III epsilon subunit-like protein
MTPVTFVDLETTGLDPEQNEIIEFAAVKTEINDGRLVILDSAEYKVWPEYPVDPFIAKLNGFNEDDWNYNATSLEEALGGIFNLMRDSWHAGSNPKFDESFLKVAAKNLHWSYPKLASYHLLDVSTMAFPLLMEGKVERLRQETIAKHYGIDGGGHRAMADAMQCLKILAKMNNLEIVHS